MEVGPAVEVQIRDEGALAAVVEGDVRAQV